MTDNDTDRRHLDRPTTARTDRRTVLRSLSALPLAAAGAGTDEQPTDRLAPDALPQPIDGKPVTVTGEVFSLCTDPRQLAPVAAYRCPYCGARRRPPAVGADTTIPQRLCPLCAVRAPTDIDDRRQIRSYYSLGLDLEEPVPARLQTDTVLIPKDVVEDWERIEIGDQIRVTGTQQELGTILPGPYTPDGETTRDGPVTRYSQRVWSQSLVQLRTTAVTRR